MPASPASAADCRDYRDLSFVGYRRREASGVADVLVAHEYINVLAQLTLFIEDAIAHAGVKIPQGGKRVGNRSLRY